MSELVEQAESHAHCNGCKCKSGDFEESPPNGIHLLNNENILQQDARQVKHDIEPEEVLEREKALPDPVKVKDSPSTVSTNELIDKFSRELTLSLINSSVLAEGYSDSIRENVQKLTDLTQSPENKTGDADIGLDSTVVFPNSKNPTNSDFVVGEKDGVRYLRYENETQMSAIMQLITKDLSEPYSIYTYRYFIHNWPYLCFLAMHDENYVGAIVCKLDLHKKIARRGYIAMLAIDKSVRRRNIGTTLVKLAIEAMHKEGCDEVVLETEVTNKPALNLYENLGFVRDKRLFRYYLNGVDALRLKLWIR